MLIDPGWSEQQVESRVDASTSLLNIGCGSHYHRDWTNIDLISDSFDVIPYDITIGLPFSENQFDAVYHSHVIEHLDSKHGIELIRECFRVLKPGGVARIVVPDLEKIAKLYLEKHDRAWQGDEQAQTDYDWMKLELLDQLVRNESGGQMGPYMANPEIRNSEFVRSRVGDEYDICQPFPANDKKPEHRFGALKKFGDLTRKLRVKFARKLVKLLLGAKAELAFAEGLFRNSGEVHRWMYDRYSLRSLCECIGFVNFQVLDAHSSQIAQFDQYELDVVEDEIRKPDSLFVECLKPMRGSVGSSTSRPVRN